MHVELQPGHGRQLEHQHGLSIQALEALRDHLANAGRHLIRARAGLALGPQELIEEERVAAAARTVTAGDLAVDAAGVLGEQRLDRVVVEPRQVDVHERALATQLGQYLPGGRLELGRPRAEQDEKPRGS